MFHNGFFFCPFCLELYLSFANQKFRKHISYVVAQILNQFNSKLNNS